VVDLCCGAGLFSAGLQRAGLEIVLGVDVDPVACDSFQANFPGAMVWEADLSEIDSLPRCDVIVGGPPCQPFSGANRDPHLLRGMVLVGRFLYLAMESGARYWIMEEVPPVEQCLEDWKPEIPRIEIWECSRFGARNLRPRLFAGRFPDPVPSGPPCETPCPTVMASDTVTPLEEMRDLQGVPGWMVFMGSETAQRRQIGNGVPLQVGEALGRGILYDLEGRDIEGHQSWHDIGAAYHRRRGGNRAYLSAPHWRWCEDCQEYIRVGTPQTSNTGVPASNTPGTPPPDNNGTPAPGPEEHPQLPATERPDQDAGEHHDPGFGNAGDQAKGTPMAGTAGTPKEGGM